MRWDGLGLWMPAHWCYNGWGQALPPASQVVMVAAEQEEVRPGRGSYLQH